MVHLRVTTLLLSTILITNAAATAQNVINLASNITRYGTPAPATCQQQAAVLAQNLLDLPRPSKWHWVILCDDAAWRQFLMQQNPDGQTDGDYETTYASTDLAAHLTILKGSNLLRPDNPLATPEHVIAHELAHIILNTRDEQRAEQQAIIWLKEREPRAGLLSSRRLSESATPHGST